MKYLTTRFNPDDPSHYHTQHTTENGIEAGRYMICQGYNEWDDDTGKPTGRIVTGWYFTESGEKLTHYLESPTETLIARI